MSTKDKTRKTSTKKVEFFLYSLYDESRGKKVENQKQKQRNQLKGTLLSLKTIGQISNVLTHKITNRWRYKPNKSQSLKPLSWSTYLNQITPKFFLWGITNPSFWWRHVLRVKNSRYVNFHHCAESQFKNIMIIHQSLIKCDATCENQPHSENLTFCVFIIILRFIFLVSRTYKICFYEIYIQGYELLK